MPWPCVHNHIGIFLSICIAKLPNIGVRNKEAIVIDIGFHENTLEPAYFYPVQYKYMARLETSLS